MIVCILTFNLNLMNAEKILKPRQAIYRCFFGRNFLFILCIRITMLSVSLIFAQSGLIILKIKSIGFDTIEVAAKEPIVTIARVDIIRLVALTALTSK